MKKIGFLFLLSIIGLSACKSSKYKDLEPGVYADIQTDKGDIVVKLHPDKAPVTVANFVTLAEGTNPYVSADYKGKPFYDGLTFHRVVSKAMGDKMDFVIQGGDPLGTGEGGPGYQFKREYSDLKHIKGAISMAREPGDPDSNGSQFFITLDATPFLDGKYNVFGETVKGFDVAQKIRPKDVIKKITIIRKGKEAKAFDAEKVFNDYMKEKVAKEKEEIEKQKQIAEKLAEKKKLAKKDESGLMVYVEKEGTGKKPKRGETVTVHYTGYLTNGKKFDSSVDRGTPFTFKVGVGQVIAGWDKGIMEMKEGEKAILYIPSYMAYGDRAVGNVIPPKSDLIFEVELLKVGK